MISLSQYFGLIFAVSLWELGIFAITRRGKLFDFIMIFCDKHLPEKLKDPIITCVTCMASLHTLLWCYLALHLGHIFIGVEFSWWLFVFLAIPCAFTNTVMWQFSAMLESVYKKMNK